MTNIVPFTGDTTLDLSPETVIHCSLGSYPGGALILGYNEDGDMAYSSSFDSAKDILWLLENVKLAILAEYGD